jgi:molecular chaperone GrpE
MTKKDIAIEEETAPENGGNGNGNGEEQTAPPEAPPLDPVEEAKRREAEMLDRLQRLAAEFDNYRKKNAGEFARGLDEGASRVLESLLPVLDSLDRAQGSTDAAVDLEALKKGFDALARQIQGILQAQGLETVVVSAGDRLDPNVHEVLFAEPSADHAPGSVLAVFQAGYRFRNRLLRPAKVKVSAEPPAGSAALKTETTDASSADQ